MLLCHLLPMPQHHHHRRLANIIKIQYSNLDNPIAGRCSRIIAKPPSESAVKAWFYNLTNSLQQIMNDEGTFLALFPRRILTSVSNCRNLRSASPSFSKDGCTHRVKSVLRLAKRQNKFTLQIGAHGKNWAAPSFLVFGKFL